MLELLVKRYIADGQPVGSRTLAKDPTLNLSPATIRNVMSDLEDLGLVTSPHASAGRIPTPKGYRFFIDQLLKVSPINEELISSLQGEFIHLNDSKQIISSASAQLSEITSMVGIVMVPQREQQLLRQIEFLPLTSNQILVILVTNESEVQNRVINTTRQYSASELEQMANYFNRHFAGYELEIIRQKLITEMEEARRGADGFMQESINLAQQVLANSDYADSDLNISGQTNLMNYSEMGNLNKLRQLFETFGRKQDMLHILDSSMNATGIQIFIGEESGFQALDECSLVTKSYQIDDEVVGVVGVIGPTRMAYDRVIPIVDLTAQLLSSALKYSTN